MAEGFKIADGFVEVHAKYDRGEVQKASEEVGRESGTGHAKGFETQLRDERGRFTRAIESAVDPEESGGKTGRGFGLAMLKDASGAFFGGFTNVLTFGLRGSSSLEESFTSNPWVAGIGAALGGAIVAAALPAVGAALSGAVIGGAGLGTIGLGAFLLRDEPAVKSAAGKLMDTVSKTFHDAAKPMLAPIVEALGIFKGLMADISPQLHQMFAAVAPAIAPLAQGLAGMVKNMLPGFLDMMKQAAPFLVSFAKTLPQLGTALSEFFSSVAKGGPGAITFFQDFLAFLDGQIMMWGQVIGWLSKAYLSVHKFFADIPGWVASAVSWFEGLGSSISGWVSSVLAWFSALPDRVGAAIESIPGRVRTLFVRVFDLATFAIGYGAGQVVKFFLDLPARVGAAIESIPGRVRSIFSSASSSAGSVAASLVSGVVGILTSLPGRAAGAVSGVVAAVSGALRGAVGAAASIGADIVRGVANGISGATGFVVSAARRAASNILSGFKSALGISSPSQVMADQVGKWIPAGIEDGIKSGLPSLRGTVNGVALALPDQMSVALSGARVSSSGSAGTVNNYYVTLDASKIKTIGDLVDMINGVKATARQFGSATTAIGRKVAVV